MRAVWNGVTLAESDDTLVVENNHYFPADSVRGEFFSDSDTHTFCPWKGEASYRTIAVGGEVNPDAAWFYPQPKEADYAGRSPDEFANRVAFWKGVTVEP
jgi:uncharacterized protein (DUF427 family)